MVINSVIFIVAKYENPKLQQPLTAYEIIHESRITEGFIHLHTMHLHNSKYYVEYISSVQIKTGF